MVYNAIIKGNFLCMKCVALCFHIGMCVIVGLIPFTITTTTSASICRLNATL